jgi:hypothetical protein
MMKLNGGLLMGALLSVLVLSGSAQADTMQTNDQAAPANTKDQVAQQPGTESTASTPATSEIRVPKKGYVRPEGNANPWAGGDTHEELRTFFGEKP